MATQVPRPGKVKYIVRYLAKRGGVSKVRDVLVAYEADTGDRIRCLATFISDARKLGAIIVHDKESDRLTLTRGIIYEQPRQRCIETLEQAVHHAEEWLARSHRGAIELRAVQLLVNYVRSNEDLPILPPESPVPPPALKSHKLFG
jgi:hypothetical protein